jgi:cytochrome c553
MKYLALSLGMAAWFGLANAAQAAGNVEAGKTKSVLCVACHGADGKGVGPNPGLTGKSEDQLLAAMKDYKTGKRDNAIMKALVIPLSDQDMSNLAAYYASLK